MRKTTIFIMTAVLGIGLARAIDFKNLESAGAQINYSARTSVVSSHTVSGYVLSWSLKAVGGTADFEVKHSTCAGLNLNVNLGSVTYLLNGETISDEFGGMVRNPLIYIKRIDTPGTTVYVDISYLRARELGRF